MNNRTNFLVLMVAAISLAAIGNQFVEAQSVVIAEGIELDTNQVIYVVIIGAIAGTVKAWQGYDKSPNDFDFVVFINGVRDSVLVAVPIAFTAALALPELNAVGYVMIFFAVIGGVSFGHKAKEKSIPSNASEEEIEKILEERD